VRVIILLAAAKTGLEPRMKKTTLNLRETAILKNNSRVSLHEAELGTVCVFFIQRPYSRFLAALNTYSKKCQYITSCLLVFAPPARGYRWKIGPRTCEAPFLQLLACNRKREKRIVLNSVA
jgi:hypothetical protein